MRILMTTTTTIFFAFFLLQTEPKRASSQKCPIGRLGVECRTRYFFFFPSKSVTKTTFLVPLLYRASLRKFVRSFDEEKDTILFIYILLWFRFIFFFFFFSFASIFRFSLPLFPLLLLLRLLLLSFLSRLVNNSRIEF